MFRIALSNLSAHKRRLLGTCSAVMLGVAFLSGTMILGDTMDHGFDTVFRTANAGTDVVVRAGSTVGSGSTAQRGTLEPSVAAAVARVPGVRSVLPQISGVAQLVGHDGRPIGGQGPPTLGGNWLDDTGVNPFHLTSGRAPQVPGEVVIDRGSARAGRLRIGDRTTVRTPTPVAVTVVGLAAFGRQDSLAGATYTLFTTEQAQQVLGVGSGRVSALLVIGRGVSATALAARVRAVLPPGVESLTGAQLTAEQRSAISHDFLDFFEGFLLVFSAVAMLVATFSIHNTFSVVLAQRTRESALLRALGATRRQVLVATAVETFAVGVVATAVGLVVGVGLAVGLNALLLAMGLGVATTGLVVDPSSLVISGLVGVVVTLIAGWAPSWAASRVPPLAALRGVAVERVGRRGIRCVVGGVLAATGLVLALGPAWGWWTAPLVWVGIGAAATLVGVVVLGPLVATPAASLLGRPLRLRGGTGDLARENAMRNPRRTAGTATALMVGIGVVTLFMVFGASLDASVSDSVARSMKADLIVQDDGSSGATLSPMLPARVADAPGVRRVAAVGFGAVLVHGESHDANFVDFRLIDGLLDLDVAQGSLSSLGEHQVAISKSVAADQRWRMGSVVPLGFVDGATEDFTVGAVFRSEDFADGIVVSRAAAARHMTDVPLDVVLVGAAPGSDVGRVSDAVDRAGRALGAPAARDRAQFVERASNQIGQVLAIVYVMLALSILIALMGIANTMSLSIHERVRELGVLRAIGQTRAQTRAMVRWEAVVISLLGTVAGVLIGLLLGWALVRGSAGEAGTGVFAAPVVRLVAIVVIGGVVGVVAGLRPARRAARLDVLAAISSS